MAICKLCQEDKKLCESHIYPEFLYKPIYDKHHSYYAISNSSDKYPKNPKKGIYEELLCKDCESHLSRYETYASDVLFGGIELAFQQKGPIIEISEIEYDLFKLFQMSLLWRASIHSRPEMPTLELGPHQERLRKMILEENPGEYYEYGVFQTTIDFDRKVLKEFILPIEPMKDRINGIRMHRSVFSGIFSVFLVSSHNHTFRFKEVFLNKEGKMKILRYKGAGKQFMHNLIKDFGTNEHNLNIKTT